MSLEQADRGSADPLPLGSTVGPRPAAEPAWVIVMANLMAMLVQYLSAKTGVATGCDLPELCREHLPRPVSLGLWVQAELVAMATDLAEFVGAAVGLNLLFTFRCSHPAC